MFNLYPNFLRNYAQIHFLILNHLELFRPRTGDEGHEGFIPNLQSKFSTLHHTDMSKELIDAVFSDSDFDQDTRDFYSFIQIQKYEPGDWIVPHHDSYAVTKLHLVTLTTSPYDGLCVATDGQIRRIDDEAGQYIDFPYDAPHWVDPVKFLRYSLVVGM